MAGNRTTFLSTTQNANVLNAFLNLYATPSAADELLNTATQWTIEVLVLQQSTGEICFTPDQATQQTKVLWLV